MVLLVPPPVTVIIPFLAAPVFAVTESMSMPLPFAPLGDTVSHEALLDAVQVAAVLTVAVLIAAVAGAAHDVGDTSSAVVAVFAKLFR